jgi:acyl carrier protein
MSTDRAAVEQTITEFLTRVEKLPQTLSADLVLQADGLGLNSLEIAELSAVLEDDFGTDLFSSDPMPETVGDIYAFYAASA